MSYCRSGSNDSDVYLIGTAFHGEPYLECFGAGWELEGKRPVHEKIMVPDWEVVDGKARLLGTKHEVAGAFTTKSRTEMINHLLDHIAAGHKVPKHAFERLQQEIEEEGDEC